LAKECLPRKYDFIFTSKIEFHFTTKIEFHFYHEYVSVGRQAHPIARELAPATTDPTNPKLINTVAKGRSVDRKGLIDQYVVKICSCFLANMPAKL
jgi:hypothetical protein